MGYAELKVPVWLERSGAPEPELVPHVMQRVRDVMRERFRLASHGRCAKSA